ncbi:germin-like protein subfamily 2 member 4 [Euphorbia lathyris]|uniref:germin-like protein subfamily 2 member 4 n=1 Tax=Euphorbia lathyris TaxID=212925 RepID=UPI0033139A29
MAPPASISILTFLAIFSSITSTLAYDPDTLQDLCVADKSSEIKLNGFPCKNEANVTEADFFFAGLAKPGVVNNSAGSLVTGANVEKIPGLNTLGVSLSRIDYAPGGLNPPHTHPRATEMIFVLEGELDVGFITTANKLISKTVKVGEIFVFPKGLVHFQKNNGDKSASVISAFNSQLPGTQSIALTLFTSNPPVPDNVLTKAFQVGTKEIEKMKTKLAPKKS